MKGFTLVELITVVAIVAILAAITVANYRPPCKRFKSVPCEIERTTAQGLERIQSYCQVCADAP